MKFFRLRLLLALSSFCVLGSVQAQVQTARSISMVSNSPGYWEYLPEGYNNSETYPLLLFIHGAGELGNNLSLVLRNGPPLLISQGQFPTSFTVNGQTHKFIVISPQFYNWPSFTDIDNILNYLSNNYRVNTNRIYITGLSMGGGATWEYVGNNTNYGNRVAAIVPVCGASWPEPSRARNIAKTNLPVWATHNSGDGTVPVQYTNDYVNLINTSIPAPSPLAKKTIWTSSSHNAWSTTYNPNYRENGLNVYEWMLQYQRGVVNPPTNIPPVANAGSDVAITLPSNSLTLSGGASDADGSITAYAWTKISGPSQFSFSNASIPNPTVSGLVAGTYVFRFSVADNLGAVSSDDMMVVVNGAANQPPSVNAGADQVLALPNNSITLSANASDQDGSISTYAWSLVSGNPNFTYSNPSSRDLSLGNLSTGTYVFRITVADNAGATASDDIQVTVVNANQPPQVNLGNDIVITLPQNWVTIQGAVGDPDGSITQYEWALVSGSPSFTNSDPTIHPLTLQNLAPGTYVFKLTVTDNLGAKASDEIQVTVNAAVNQPPIVNAGFDQVINLPNNSVTLTASASDVDGSITAYGWSLVSGNATFQYSDPYSSSLTISNLTEGTYVFRITVTDNSGATTSDEVGIVVVQSSNRAPVANAGEDISIHLPTNSISLHGSGHDPDGTITGVQWTKVSGPAQFSISNGNTATPTISNLVEGVYVFKMELVDNLGARESDMITITVYPNSTPPPSSSRIEAEDFIAMNGIQVSGGIVVGIDPGDYMAYQINAPVDDNYSFTFNVSSANGSRQFYIVNSAGTAVLATVNVPQTGSGKWTLVSTDVHLPAGQQNFFIYSTTNEWLIDWIEIVPSHITPINQSPVAIAGVDITLTLPNNSATLSGAGTDADGSIAAYGWSQVSGPTLATISNPSGPQTTVSNLVAGVYVFQLAVADNEGAIGTDQVTIIVNQIISPPPSSSTRIQAEQFSSMHGIQIVNTYYVGYFDVGDWVGYSLNIPVSGTYTFTFRVAPPNAPRTFNVIDGSGTVTLATVQIPVTRWYGDYTLVTVNMELQAGSQMIYLLSTSTGWDIDWFEYSGPSSAQAQSSHRAPRIVETEPASTTAFNTYPNPIRNQFTLQLNNNERGRVYIQIVDMKGAVRKQYLLNKNQQQVQFQIPGESLTPGQYIVKVQIGKWKETKKILKL